MLAGRTLAVVLVTNRAPTDSCFAISLGDLRIRATLSVRDVQSFADRTSECIDRTEEQVARDVLQVSAVGEPLARGGDVVGRALALSLHQDRQIDVVLSVPRWERLEKLQTIARRAHFNNDAGTICRWCSECVNAGVVPARGENVAAWLIQLHLRAVRCLDGVDHGVEIETAGQSDCHHGVGAGDE